MPLILWQLSLHLFFVSILIVNDTNDPKAVQQPFAIIGVVTLAILVALFFLKLPEIKQHEGYVANKTLYKSSAFKYPHVWLGSLAIFFYMAIEVGIPSFFLRLYR